MKTLTARERQVAEHIAWGATKKEIADHLCISVHTVENHTRGIYEKTGCRSCNELSAWWFCTRFNISFALSPLARNIIALFFIGTYFFGSFNPATDKFRRTSTQTVRTVRARTRRRQENDYIL